VLGAALVSASRSWTRPRAMGCRKSASGDTSRIGAAISCSRRKGGYGAEGAARLDRGRDRAGCGSSARANAHGRDRRLPFALVPARGARARGHSRGARCRGARGQGARGMPIPAENEALAWAAKSGRFGALQCS
jgi:hypothetical protein